MRNLGSQGINLVNATKVEYEKAMYILVMCKYIFFLKLCFFY